MRLKVLGNIDISEFCTIIILKYLANLLKGKDAKLWCLSEFRMIDRLHLLGAAGFYFEVII